MGEGMGSFSGVIFIRTEDVNAVRKAAVSVGKRHGRGWFLAPAPGGWLAVYPDEGGQDEEAVEALARRVKVDAVYLLNHDNDLFCYTVFRGGKILDRYCNRPDYFARCTLRERNKLRGNPALFADLFAEDTRVQRARELLDEATMHPEMMADEPMAAFAALLGLPDPRGSYEDLADGFDLPWIASDQLIHLPSPDEQPDEDAEDAEDRASLRQYMRETPRMQQQDLQRLRAYFADRRADGILLNEINWPTGDEVLTEGERFSIDPSDGGVLLIEGPGRQDTRGMLRLPPPYTGSVQPLALRVPARANMQSVSGCGNYLLTYGLVPPVRRNKQFEMQFHTQIRRLHDAELVFEHTGPSRFLLSPDEQFLVQSSWQAINISTFPKPRVLAALDATQLGTVRAIHQDGPTLLASKKDRLTCVDLPSGRTRTLPWPALTPKRYNNSLDHVSVVGGGEYLLCITPAGISLLRWCEVRDADADAVPAPVYSVIYDDVNTDDAVLADARLKENWRSLFVFAEHRQRVAAAGAYDARRHELLLLHCETRVNATSCLWSLSLREAHLRLLLDLSTYLYFDRMQHGFALSADAATLFLCGEVEYRQAMDLHTGIGEFLVWDYARLAADVIRK